MSSDSSAPSIPKDESELMKPMLTLICGYTTHGKDQIAKDIKDNQLFDSHRWIILSKNQNETLKFANPVKIVSYAAELKRETLEFLRIGVPWKFLESVKDTLMLPHPDNENDVRVLRAWYIWFGAEGRKINPDVWVSKALDPFIWSNDNVMVTDWRFQNEFEYPAGKMCWKTGIEAWYQGTHLMQTIRVFRGDAKIPADDIASEHSLDKIETDFLAVSKPSDISLAMERFPQYKYHQYIHHRCIV